MTDRMPVRLPDLDEAEWITHPAWASGEPPLAPPVLATRFTPPEAVGRVVVTIQGLGVWAAYLNGTRISDDVLEPGMSEFLTRSAAVSYDITALLGDGEHELVLELGDGSSFVRALPARYTKLEGRRVSPRARVAIAFETDGRPPHVVRSGPDWLAATGPTTLAHWYGGEDYDARLEPRGWHTGMIEGDFWAPAAVLPPRPNPAPWAPATPPMRAVDTLHPVARVPAGDAVVVDFGRNTAGREIVTVTDALAPGTRVELWPAEYVDADGHVDQHSTGEPIFDTFVAAGRASTWGPTFCYHGFRYVEVRVFDPQGDPVRPPAGAVELVAEQIMTVDRPVGTFDCSDPVISGIHALVVRAIESNLVSVPTDCPHREKLGWLEQTHLVFDPVSRSFDIRAHWSDLITHMVDAQLPDGLIPDIAPELIVFDVPTHIGPDHGYRDDVNWGSAIWQVPLRLYDTYGDLEPARVAWDAGVRYLAYIDALAEQCDGGVLDRGLADWITLDDSTPRALVAGYGHVAMLDAAAALGDALGRGAEGTRFRDRGATLRGRMRRRLVRHDEGGVTIGSGSQASIALMVDLGGVLTEEEEALAASALVAGLRDNGAQLTVGEIGLPALLRVLAGVGEQELIRELATQTHGPGYGRMLADGCTALTEHWSGVESRASANHFMLGYISWWFTDHVAGLRRNPAELAWRSAIVAPAFLEGVDHASSSYDSVAGEWRVAWRRANGAIHLEVCVPEGATARLELPAGTAVLGPVGDELAAGRHTLTVAVPV